MFEAAAEFNHLSREVPVDAKKLVNIQDMYIQETGKYTRYVVCTLYNLIHILMK